MPGLINKFTASLKQKLGLIPKQEMLMGLPKPTWAEIILFLENQEAAKLRRVNKLFQKIIDGEPGSLHNSQWFLRLTTKGQKIYNQYTNVVILPPYQFFKAHPEYRKDPSTKKSVKKLLTQLEKRITDNGPAQSEDEDTNKTMPLEKIAKYQFYIEAGLLNQKNLGILTDISERNDVVTLDKIMQHLGSSLLSSNKLTETYIHLSNSLFDIGVMDETIHRSIIENLMIALTIVHTDKNALDFFVKLTGYVNTLTEGLKKSKQSFQNENGSNKLLLVANSLIILISKRMKAAGTNPNLYYPHSHIGYFPLVLRFRLLLAMVDGLKLDIGEFFQNIVSMDPNSNALNDNTHQIIYTIICDTDLTELDDLIGVLFLIINSTKFDIKQLNRLLTHSLDKNYSALMIKFIRFLKRNFDDSSFKHNNFMPLLNCLYAIRNLEEDLRESMFITLAESITVLPLNIYEEMSKHIASMSFEAITVIAEIAKCSAKHLLFDIDLSQLSKIKDFTHFGKLLLTTHITLESKILSGSNIRKVFFSACIRHKIDGGTDHSFLYFLEKVTNWNYYTILSTCISSIAKIYSKSGSTDAWNIISHLENMAQTPLVNVLENSQLLKLAKLTDIAENSVKDFQTIYSIFNDPKVLLLIVPIQGRPAPLNIQLFDAVYSKHGIPGLLKLKKEIFESIFTWQHFQERIYDRLAVGIFISDESHNEHTNESAFKM